MHVKEGRGSLWFRQCTQAAWTQVSLDAGWRKWAGSNSHFRHLPVMSWTCSS